MKKKDFKKYLYLFINPILFMICLWFINNEFAIFFILLFFIGFSFWLKYEKKEIYLFLVGTLLGIILELGGDYFNQMQYWDSGSFFGIPIWLPILWGFGAVYLRKFGNCIVNKKF